MEVAEGLLEERERRSRESDEDPLGLNWIV